MLALKLSRNNAHKNRKRVNAIGDVAAQKCLTQLSERKSNRWEFHVKNSRLDMQGCLSTGHFRYRLIANESVTLSDKNAEEGYTKQLQREHKPSPVFVKLAVTAVTIRSTVFFGKNAPSLFRTVPGITQFSESLSNAHI